MLNITQQIEEPGFRYYLHRPLDGASIVSHVWCVSASRCSIAVEAKLPDSGIELYFNLGSGGRYPVRPHDVDMPSGRRCAWVVGPHANVLLLAKETVDCDIVGVRLQPGSVPLVLGAPADAIQESVVDLELFWGKQEVWRILERLHAARTLPDRLLILEHEITAHLIRGQRFESQMLCNALRGPRAQKVGQLAANLGLSHRRMIALVREHVGLAPKEFQRVDRLRQVLARLHARRSISWAQVAVDSGYCDQAHLIHEFRRLTGLTPSQYLAARTSVGEGFVPYRRAR
jgi:AraC-like DNA-binding protein